MLTELTNHIKKALISYMKSLEGDQLQDQYEQGLLGIVIRCRSVSDDRKRDIEALNGICQSALRSLAEPAACIKQVVDYLNTMKTGFLFFRGKSKLKESIITAINIYDPRYIANAKDHPIELDAEAMNRPIQPGLAPSNTPPISIGQDQAVISPAMKQQFDDLRRDLARQREELATQKLLVEQLRESLQDMGSIVEEKDRTINDLKVELLQRRGESTQENQRSNGMGHSA